MTRIPEDIDFEKLFNWSREDSGRDDGGQGEGGAGERRVPGEPTQPRGRGWAIAVAGIVALIASARGLAWLLSEWWWFDSLGHSDLLRLRILAPLAVFAVVAGVGSIWLAANWLWAARRSSGGPVWPGQQVSLPSGRALRNLVVASALAIGAFTAIGPAASWTVVALFLRGGSFGQAEPLFGRDVSFYTFSLPFYEWLVGIVAVWLLVALVGTAIIYAAGGVADLRKGQLRISPQARTHLLGLGALVAVMIAVNWWLARYHLLFSERIGGVFSGPGYTDVHIRLPALTLLAGVALVSAAILLIVIRVRKRSLVIGAVAVPALAWLLFLAVLPPIIQRLRVEPDELSRERPYIAHNIEMTRAAFGLADVQETEYDPSGEVTTKLLADNRSTVANLRLWDWRVLKQVYQNLQEFRDYYVFQDVDIDRYALADGPRQVNLAVRELDRTGLPNPSWVNEHLEFTHGFGTTVSPVDEFNRNGEPVLWMKDMPTVTNSPFELELEQPRVYFGELAYDDYVVVGTTTDEFDYPMGQSNVRTSYEGADGVSVGSFIRQLVFAIRFGDIEVLFSDALTDDSRILMHRGIVERVNRLAPFLQLDPDPYAVIGPDGGLVWIIDGYTVTDQYPYARHLPGRAAGASSLAGNNYVRNSVKVVVDAYEGETKLYVVDPDDPVLKAWSEVYPGLITAVDEMPMAFREHWRYPEALFRAQAEMFKRYHMTEADVFYNAEDVWAIPTETRAQGETVEVQPYYVTLKLRGEESNEFVLILPYTPSAKPVMIAWLAARSDPEHYGELVVYRFSKGQDVVNGPQQIENRIDNDTDISAQLTLWSQSGSQTIRGNLLVYPIEDTLLYVEPLFLQADSGSFPLLKRVIVASRDRVVMRETLAEALAALVDSPLAGDRSDAGSDGDRDDEQTDGDASSGLSLEMLVRQAAESEQAARDALTDGDWPAFGRAMDRVQRNLDRLADQLGVEAPTPEPEDAGASGAESDSDDAGSSAEDADKPEATSTP